MSADESEPEPRVEECSATSVARRSYQGVRIKARALIVSLGIPAERELRPLRHTENRPLLPIVSSFCRAPATMPGEEEQRHFEQDKAAEFHAIATHK